MPRASASSRSMTGLGFADTDGNGILNVPSDPASTAFDPEGAGQDWSLRIIAREDHTDQTLAGDLIATWLQAAGIDAGSARSARTC